jgi:hypothetical protein
MSATTLRPLPPARLRHPCSVFTPGPPARPRRPSACRPRYRCLDAGVPLRDVQEAASHADPRTTMRYDRARVSLDRHATYIVATFIAGATAN